MPVIRTLREIYEDCLSLTRNTSPKSIDGVPLYKWRGNTDDLIIGELKFGGLPSFNLNIFDDTHVLPCLILNPARNFKKLLKLYGHVIVVRAAELIVEITIVKTRVYSSVHMLLDAERVYITNENIPQTSLALKESERVPSRNNSDIATHNWEQKFIPVKVSSVLRTFNYDVLCLILASLVDSDAENNTQGNLVWLIFRNGQALWKDMLLPTQIYSIVMPENIPRDHFSKYSSLTSVVDANLDTSFKQILHHGDIVKTNKAVFLPEKAKVVAMATSHNPVEIPHLQRWYSVSDSKLQYLKFASVVGVIREVHYSKTFKSNKCTWCPSEHDIFEKTRKEPSNFEMKEIDSKLGWSDFFNEPANIDENEAFILPNENFDVPKEEMSTFGICGGKMCARVTLQHLSYDCISVFIKPWKQQQYPFGLVPGVTVCITDVNVRHSRNHQIYLISTPFTRVLHLDSDFYESLLGGDRYMQLLKFGFPSVDRFYQNKIWGICEFHLLLKVSIKAKCRSCEQPLQANACCSTLCPKFNDAMGSECDIVVIARLFVHNICGPDRSTLYLKNENVQKYLGLPSRIWRHLCDLSTNYEICYSYQKEELELTNVDKITRFFYIYCKYLLPRKRFHVICKQFEDDGSRFFGVDLEEITEERLNFARCNFEKAIEKATEDKRNQMETD